MLKNTEKYEEQSKSHFTYDEYRKKMKKRPNRDITIFISVFIVGVLILLGFAKVLSPNVDVGITDSEKDYPSYSEEDNVKQASIDERLKKLQMEDNGEMFSPELDEKVVIPNLKKKVVQKEVEEDEVKETKIEEKAVVNVPVETKVTKETHEKEIKENNVSKSTQNSTQNTTTPTQITSAKVVIGSYANEKQAEVAKSILQDSGIGVTPIIKNIGGTYTLQVGAYSTREKAQQSANSLIKSNFPARVIVE